MARAPCTLADADIDPFDDAVMLVDRLTVSTFAQDDGNTCHRQEAA
ncbi:MAG: hypothetical protein WC107_00765 [Patescibacteria group bacterium]